MAKRCPLYIPNSPALLFKNTINSKDIGNQNFYCLYLLGILTEYLILYYGRFVAFSCRENVIKSSTVVRHFENKHLCHSIHYLTSLAG